MQGTGVQKFWCNTYEVRNNNNYKKFGRKFTSKIHEF